MAANALDSDAYLLPDEAAEFLGVKPAQLGHLLQRFGVGRYHQPVEGRQFVYARSDIERVKSLTGGTSEDADASAE